MDTFARNLWLIPALPLLAAGLTALARRPQPLLQASQDFRGLGEVLHQPVPGPAQAWITQCRRHALGLAQRLA